MASKDFKKQKKWDILDHESQRATPAQLNKYNPISIFIKFNTTSDSNLAELIKENAYINDRPYRRAENWKTIKTV